MMTMRGVDLAHTTIMRWIQRCVPLPARLGEGLTNYPV
jgi:transposase-like protein